MARIAVGLSNGSETVADESVKRAAAALAIQVRRDLKLAWDVDADVVALPKGAAIPLGIWPIFVTDHPPGGFAGVHTCRPDGLPWAVVSTKRDWRLAASHELIEMLVDPTGEKTVPSLGLALADGTVADAESDFAYLLEVCDPIEDADHAYEIDGVPVSDFYTPSYFDRAPQPGRRYSFNGAITRPREVRPGGYLSWRLPDNRLQQLRNFGPAPEIVDLPEHGPAPNQTLRMFIDQHTLTPRVQPEAFKARRSM